MRLHEPQVVERRAAGFLLVDAGVDGQRPHPDPFQLPDPLRHVVDADHVDDNCLAVFGSRLQAGGHSREIGHAERGDVVGARLERQPRLIFPGVHDLDVGEHLHFRKARLERPHRGQALRDDERRPDLENIDNAPDFLAEAQRFLDPDMVQRQLQLHVPVSFGARRAWSLAGERDHSRRLLPLIEIRL